MKQYGKRRREEKVEDGEREGGVDGYVISGKAQEMERCEMGELDGGESESVMGQMSSFFPLSGRA